MTKSVLIIYTGGTIGMVNDPATGALCPFDFEQIAKAVPEIREFGFSIRQLYFTGDHRFVRFETGTCGPTCAQIILDKLRSVLADSSFCTGQIRWLIRPQP